GWSFYLLDGRPAVYLAASTKPEHQFRIVTKSALPPGPVTVRYEFTPDQPGFFQGGAVHIFAGDKLLGEGRVERAIARPAGLGETFDIGFDAGTPVTTDYVGQGRFPGAINKVSVQLGEFTP